MRKILLILCVFSLFSALKLNAIERTVGIAQAVSGTTSSSLGAESITSATNVTVEKIISSSGDTLTNLTNKVGSSPKSVKYDGSDRYPEKLYKWNKSATSFYENRYVGYSVTISSGYKMSLSSLSVELATTANFTWKVVIEKPAGTVLYTSSSMTISNYDKSKSNKTPITNYSLNPTLSENSNVQDLTGTFYVKVYPYYNSTGKYFCFPSFTITGDVEEFAACAATAPGNISKGSACAGNDLTLTSAGSPASGDTWYWQTSSTGTSTTNSGATYDVSEAGTYYVRSYNTSGTCWSDAKSVTVAAGDWTSPSISGASSVTVGNTITLTGSPSGGSWESSDETKAEVNSSGVVTGVAAGNVNITYSKDGCTSDNHAVTVSAVVCSPSISVSPASANYCKDDIATALFFTGSGHNAQKWQKSTDGGSSWSDIDGATNATYTPPTSATGSTQYRVVTTCDSYTTTATSSAATVTVKTSPNLTISLN